MTPAGGLERYAKLAVEVGVNLRPGQDLVVLAEVEHTPLVRHVARAAYAAGARHVVAARRPSRRSSAGRMVPRGRYPLARVTTAK